MSLKNKLIENIVAPVALSHSAISLDAKVLSSNQKTNTCSIEYRDNKGVRVKQHNVYIQQISRELLAWFPKKNDKVLITVKNNDIIVTGPSVLKYQTQTRLEFKEDIYSDSTSAFLGGSIF